MYVVCPEVPSRRCTVSYTEHYAEPDAFTLAKYFRGKRSSLPPSVSLPFSFCFPVTFGLLAKRPFQCDTSMRKVWLQTPTFPGKSDSHDTELGPLTLRIDAPSPLLAVPFEYCFSICERFFDYASHSYACRFGLIQVHLSKSFFVLSLWSMHSRVNDSNGTLDYLILCRCKQ